MAADDDTGLATGTLDDGYWWCVSGTTRVVSVDAPPSCDGALLFVAVVATLNCLLAPGIYWIGASGSTAIESSSSPVAVLNARERDASFFFLP